MDTAAHHLTIREAIAPGLPFHERDRAQALIQRLDDCVYKIVEKDAEDMEDAAQSFRPREH
ncbi:hypothetical protein MXD81_49110 [Microbacteriaceae bacterium K1510]|nr:hypothetical protein [Microbacteriaceae bacterium K1510]